MKKETSTKDKSSNGVKADAISCCIEYMQRGKLQNIEVQCERPAVFMVKAGSYNSEKFYPMCKRHRDKYKGRVETLLKRWNMKVIYEELHCNSL